MRNDSENDVQIGSFTGCTMQREILSCLQERPVPWKRENRRFYVQAEAGKSTCWTPKDLICIQLESLCLLDGVTVDQKRTRIGIRTAVFDS